MDKQSFDFFDNLRRRHFPAERNLVPAHLSLFHSLPGDELDQIMHTLESTCRTLTPFSMTVSGLRNLGRGVAFKIESRELAGLHAELRRAFSDWLTPQDQQPFRPHITVQNKATVGQVKQLLAALETQYRPAAVTGVGIQLWRYLDGPWEPLGCVPLAHPD